MAGFVLTLLGAGLVRRLMYRGGLPEALAW